MELSAKQIDVSAFLARVRTEPLPFITQLTSQLSEAECDQILALRNQASEGVQGVLQAAAERRASEAAELASEPAEEASEVVEDETAVLDESTPPASPA